MPAPRTSRDSFLHRLVAAGGIALVFALGLFAASPALHSWLHLDNAIGEDECPVAIFATGVSAPATPLTLSIPALEWQAYVHIEFAELLLSSPRYLHQPGRGPPAV